MRATLTAIRLHNFEKRTQNRRSAGNACGRFTDGLSIASCWRSAKFSSVNWRRDLNKEQTVLSTANNRLRMLVMLQQLPEKVNDIKPILFSGGTRSEFCV